MYMKNYRKIILILYMKENLTHFYGSRGEVVSFFLKRKPLEGIISFATAD